MVQQRRAWPFLSIPEYDLPVYTIPKDIALNAERPARNTRNRSVRILLFLIAVPLGLFLLSTVTLVPPIAGRVVDAVTGKSIRGVSIGLHMSYSELWSIHTEDIGTSSTDTLGWFFLPGALHWVGFPNAPFRAYWLTVNEENSNSGQEEMSAAGQVLGDPMFNQRGSPIGNKKYFPITVTFRQKGCDRVWAAACAYRRFWWGISVPLIPVLDDTGGCKKIKDSSLRENCRQLNTYRAAFVHVDSYEEVRNAKKLCSQVDGGLISKECLRQLDFYIANAGNFYQRQMKAQVNEPIPEGIFADVLAGVPLLNKQCGPRLAYSGRVMCGATYGSEAKTLVVAHIEEFPEDQQSTKPPEWKPQYTDYRQAAVTVESQPDGKVLRYRGPQYNSFYWHSGDRHVEVFFYYPIPQEQQFVSYYLKKFPSNFQ